MATAGVTVGSVWLDVLPSMRNFGSELVNQTEGVSRQAGERSGEALGEGTADGFRGKAAMVAAAGAAIGLAVGAAISNALDIQAGQARLTAQLGLTAGESERYGRIAGQLYSSAYGESLDQVNEAIAAVHRNIGDNLNDADLSRITGTVLNLADTFDVDLGQATEAVGNLMRNGLAPNAEVALDVITVGFQNGLNRSDDFLDTLREYTPQFAKFGLDAQMATGLLTQGMEAGARNSDIVADAIKEFSIRAIDGSKLTAEGFAMVGLNAADMASKIAQGGPTASAALDLTLDRLRAMPDPVMRSQAAVALFGSQAEDLGNALFALDPSAAVAALGHVGGAADAMNATLGATAQATLTSFMRTLQLVFVDIVGGYVIPAITALAAIIGPVLGPALSVVGFVITGVIVPAFQALGTWVQNNSSWLLPLAAGIGAFTLAANAAAIATAVWGAATSVAATIMGIARGAVLAFQVGVWLLNAAMAANPVGLVVALLVGLVAGLVVAWNTSETFRNVVTGAWTGIQAAASTAWSFLQSVFAGIGVGASAVGSALATAWGGAVTAFQAVGTAASWLWNTILSPVFSAIGLAVRIVAAVLFTILVAPWLIAFNLLSAAVSALYTVAFKPAFDGIVAAATVVWALLDAYVFQPIGVALGVLGALFGGFATEASGAWQSVQAALSAVWTVIDSVVFAPIRAGLALIGVAMGIFQTAASGAWTAVQTALSAVWTWIKSTVIDPFIAILQVGLAVAMSVFQGSATGAWQAVQNAINEVWNIVLNNVFRPVDEWLQRTFGVSFGTFQSAAIGAWNAVRDAINTVWSFIRDSIWQPLVTFVTQTIPNAFNTAVDAVGRVWDGLREKFAGPIRFVVDVVYNQGIVKAWNWIANLVALPPLSTVNLGFARGGVVPGYGAAPGYAPGRDSMLAMVSPGEAWMRPEFTRTVGSKWIDQVNAVARRGGEKAVEAFLMFGGEKPQQFAAGGVVAAQGFARAQAGKPYVWGGVGPGGYDCSGFISAVTNVALGQSPHSRRFATGSFGASRGAGGFVPGTGSAFVIGVSPDTGSGVGHMSGSLGGVGIESRGSAGVIVGGGARSPNDSLFPWRFFLPQVGGEFVDSGGGGGWFDPVGWVKSLFKGAIDAVAGLAGDTEWAKIAAGTGKAAVDGTVDWFVDWATNNVAKIIDLIIPFDTGGYLPTGWSTVYNGTGRPEPVLTDAQWSAMAESGAGTDGASLDSRFAELADAIRAQPPITVEDRSGNPVDTARQVQLAIRLGRR